MYNSFLSCELRAYLFLRVKGKKRPTLVSFIADLNFLNAFLLIVSLFPIPNFAERFGIYFSQPPTFSEGVIRLLVAIMLLIIFYGLLRLKRWGFWLMIAYNYFFSNIYYFFVETYESTILQPRLYSINNRTNTYIPGETLLC